jgi:hypothetical protein
MNQTRGDFASDIEFLLLGLLGGRVPGAKK